MTPATDTIAHVQNWVSRTVVGLNLCPFARREVDAGRVRYTLSDARSPEDLLHALADEMHWLDLHPETATTLLIHPQVLTRFADYNQFLDLADGLLEELDRDGVYQIASFHPDYQFAGTAPDAAENYSNRSPYPMLHLIREEQLAAAVDAHPDPEGIPARNIALLNEMGSTQMHARLQDCLANAAAKSPSDDP